eukprot:GHUV01017392.1.p2 GENE.GHUV01017392.1~~GHUV01017392.1.p2  ORF type:complete len:122 (+),score=8.49 GHUV01017392.1:911-1276(+)
MDPTLEAVRSHLGPGQEIDAVKMATQMANRWALVLLMLQLLLVLFILYCWDSAVGRLMYSWVDSVNRCTPTTDILLRVAASAGSAVCEFCGRRCVMQQGRSCNRMVHMLACWLAGWLIHST